MLFFVEEGDGVIFRFGWCNFISFCGFVNVVFGFSYGFNDRFMVNVVYLVDDFVNFVEGVGVFNGVYSVLG